MRIVGGTKKGFPLKKPKSGDIRPTTDKIKASLFNILRTVEGANFLDLFAGTGGVGMEALSRGAHKVVFIERNTTSAGSIKEDIKQLEFENQAEVISLEMKKALPLLAERRTSFNYIFIDPPYQRDLVRDSLSCIAKMGLAGEETLLIVQHSKREPIQLEDDGFSVVDCRNYGDTMLTFLKLKKEAGT